jgi:putative ABC transport system permease protein
MSWVSGWRLALRMAWREAWRSKARSVLVLVMVTFPVVVVVAADVAQATSSVNAVESLDRRIGTAQARVTTLPGVEQVFQSADPDSGGYGADGGHGPAASLADVEGALGGGRPTIELRDAEVQVRTDLGVLRVGATAVDLRSPLAHGLFRLTSGRLPSGRHEVAVNGALADEGFHVGGTIAQTDGSTATIVGTAESTGTRTSPQLVGDTDWLPPPHGPHTWLVGGSPVTWQQVRAVNGVGGLVLSREVVEHPPATDQLPPQVRDVGSSDRSALYAVLALVGVMALIEVVLLAGPAFAVGARRQSRSLALIAANGGTPAQSRRVVLGAAVVIGACASGAGAVLGVGLGRALIPVLQSMSDTYFGPFQIRWDHVLGIAAFGLVSALLAAVVPAWIASRQDVVAVLAGRRGDRAASRRSPFIGVALVVAGILLAVLGARQGSGETLIAGAAVLSVFGMIFLVPSVVVAVARLGRRFPLPLRYAVRDAARHRTRTVPAVAAVAATVAGIVALSIGNTSDQAGARGHYQPMLGSGLSSIAMNGAHPDWAAVEAAVTRTAPGARPERVLGVRGSRPLMIDTGTRIEGGFMSSLPLQALVSSDGALPLLLQGQVSAEAWRAAAPVLARGGVVVLDSQPRVIDHAVLSAGGSRNAPTHVRTRVPARVVSTGGEQPWAMAVLSPAAARALHARVLTVGLLLAGETPTPAQSDALRQVLAGMDPSAYLYTERGYQVSSSERIVLWILFGLAAVLMLGGTLTATFLALSDARPDLATLSAVGASPRTRRAVASAYAVSVGVVGAVLGAAVGFVPGIAISYPLTRDLGSESGPSHYLAIPWLEIAGLVVLLPLVTALVVGLLARSRLPLVARLD